MATGASLLAAAMLFTGCAGVTHEPKVDMSSLTTADEDAFIAALDKIGISDSDIDAMYDTSFSLQATALISRLSLTSMLFPTRRISTATHAALTKQQLRLSSISTTLITMVFSTARTSQASAATK